MDARDQPGLRERKKLRTREAIRREAFRLFEERGYTNTTVEQIAEAADISSRTYFRYFPTKEHVLIDDNLVPPIIEAFIAAPAELPPIEAYKHAVLTTFAALSPAERETAMRGQRIMYTVPETRALLYAHYVSLISMIAEALRHRLPQPVSDFERRVMAGSIVGVLIACSDGTPLPGDPISDGLDVLKRRLDLD